MKHRLCVAMISVAFGAFMGFVYGHQLIDVPQGTPSPLVAAGLVSALANGLLSLFATLVIFIRDCDMTESQFSFGRTGALAYLLGALVFLMSGFFFAKMTYFLLAFSLLLGFAHGLAAWQLKHNI